MQLCVYCFLQALADVLQEGGAPELINLDLRGNTLSDHAQQLLVSKHHAQSLLQPVQAVLEVHCSTARQSARAMHGS
jgi:hypothetical protein